jgi:hypothetical protein
VWRLGDSADVRPGGWSLVTVLAASVLAASVLG